MKQQVSLKTILLTILIISSLTLSAQYQLNLRSGLAVSSFLFKNSNGKFDNSYKYNIGNYTAFSFDANIGKLHTIRPSIAYRQAGAFTYIEKTKVKYDLRYADISLAYLINCYSNDKVKLYAGVDLSLGVLLLAEQSSGADNYNLRSERAVRDIEFMPHAVLGTKIKILDPLYFGIEYRFGISANNIESDAQLPSQAGRNMTHNLLFGLSFNLPQGSKKNDTEQPQK
jgi:hypothetical protein